MRDYIDVTGKTEEEAIRRGLEQLQMEREDVSVEILERAKAGFLGFGSAPAKVRISYGEERPDPVEPPAVETPKPERKPVRERRRDTPRDAESDAVGGEPDDIPSGCADGRGEEPDAGPAKPERSRNRRRNKRDKAARAGGESPVSAESAPPAGEDAAGRRNASRKGGTASERRPAADAPAPKAEPSAPKPEPSAPVPLGEEVDDEKAQAIKTFLTGLLAHMGQEAAVKVYLPETGRYKVILEGTGLGALIGRRGETLDAMQQLTSYAVNRGGARVRIHLDAEGYREKREQSLQRLAKKTAAKVVKSRRSFTLEPMNAYERHVIHTALQDFPGVVTYSTGVDPNRRVIIAIDRDRA